MGLPRNMTFGVEIEYEDVDKAIIDNIIKREFRDWKSVSDCSLKSGGEIVTPRIRDEKRHWESLYKVCEYLKSNNANTSVNTGVHVHIGAHILGDNINYLRNFAKLYTLYEYILVRFGYGEKLSSKNSLLNYAKPSAYRLFQNFDLVGKKASLADLKKFFELLKNNKEVALNMRRLEMLPYIVDGNTLEFRSFNSTTSPQIIQNEINAVAKLVLAATKPISDFYFRQRENELSYTDSEDEYLATCNEIYFYDALFFSDILFDNLFDKLCFLKQYCKDYEPCSISTGNNYGRKIIL